MNGGGVAVVLVGLFVVFAALAVLEMLTTGGM